MSTLLNLPCGHLRELILVKATSYNYDHFFKFLRSLITYENLNCVIIIIITIIIIIIII